MMQETWELRHKSGNKFRGEVNADDNHAEGRGIKIFSNGGIYEGYFAD